MLLKQLMKVIDINEKKTKREKKVDQLSILVSLLSNDFANRMNAIKNQNIRNEAMACILLHVLECLKNGQMTKEQVLNIIDVGIKRSFPE
jgi:hypothetical protein